jgi:hypothetical protein
MAYGSLKVDNIIFTNGGVDQTITVSGIVAATSGNLTVTGTISGAVVQGGTLVSGATVTGAAGQFTTLTGGTAGFTTVTGTTVTGTTANFVSGVFTTQISGATVTGNTAGFTTITGTTVTGTTANFATISGTTITGGHVTTASGTFTGNVTAAAFVPTATGIPTNGVYLPAANNVAISTNGTGRLFVDSSGRVLVGTSSSLGNGILQARANTDSTTGEGIVIIAKGDGATAGQTLGQIKFINSTGNQAAYITAIADAGWGGSGSADYAGALTFSTTADNTSSPTERMRLDSSGRLGIGTTSPVQESGIGLHINNSSGQARIKLTNNISGATASDGFDIIQEVDASASVHLLNHENGPLKFGTNDAERARIDSSGRLLVGTSSSFSAGNSQYGRFQSVGNTFATPGNGIIAIGRSEAATAITTDEGIGAIYFTDNAGNEFGLISCAADANAGSGDYPGRLVFSTTADNASSPTERMRIDRNGTVSIGTNFTATGLALNVYGNSSSNNDGAASFGNANTTADACVAAFYTATNSTATSNVLIKFGINNYASGSGQINSNGSNAAAFGTFSDQRLKENIVELPSQWDSVKNLRPVEFDYIESEGGGHQIGFIAQEVENIYPDVVGERSDGMLTLSGMSKQDARLIKALQEAMERIETLEAEVAALKGA